MRRISILLGRVATLYREGMGLRMTEAMRCRAELARLLFAKNQKQPSKLGSTRRRDPCSAATDACLQQGPQFVLVGFVEAAIAVLGLQFLDALFDRLSLQLGHGIVQFHAPGGFIAG